MSPEPSSPQNRQELTEAFQNARDVLLNTENTPQDQTSEDMEAARQEAQSELANDNRLRVASERMRRVGMYQEVLETEPKSIEELINLINIASFEQVAKQEKESKYGKGLIGSFKQFLAGEQDFNINKQGEVQRDGWNQLKEAGRKFAMTVFNRRTLAAGGSAALIGVLTGGIGWAASGVVLGSMAGRGLAETIDSLRGKERQSRIKVAQAERSRWYELKELSAQLEETEDSEKKYQLMKQITDLYYNQGESAVIKELHLAEQNAAQEKEGLNRLRNNLQRVGEIAGAGAGIAHGLLSGHAEAIDIDLWNKVDGQSIAHDVVKINDAWHFMEGNATGLLSSGFDQGAIQSAHAFEGATVETLKSLGFASVGEALRSLGIGSVGEPAWKIGAALAVERALPVLMSSVAANYFGGQAEKKTEEKEQKTQAEHTTISSGRINDQISESQKEETKKTEQAKKDNITRLNKIAVERGLSELPAGPTDLPEGWQRDPNKLASKHFAINDKAEPIKEGLPVWHQVEPTGLAKIKNGERFLVRVLETNPENNSITYLKKYAYQNDDDSTSTYWQIETINLDQFMQNYRPTILEQQIKAPEAAQPTKEKPKEGQVIKAPEKKSQTSESTPAFEKGAKIAKQIEAQLPPDKKIQVQVKKVGDNTVSIYYEFKGKQYRVHFSDEKIKQLKDRALASGQPDEFIEEAIVEKVSATADGKVDIALKE